MDHHQLVMRVAGQYQDSPEEQRAAAVTLALDIIKAKCGGGADTQVGRLMDSLSSFADQIQEAVKVK